MVVVLLLLLLLLIYTLNIAEEAAWANGHGAGVYWRVAGSSPAICACSRIY
jgi:hypothetical protein